MKEVKEVIGGGDRGMGLGLVPILLLELQLRLVQLPLRHTVVLVLWVLPVGLRVVLLLWMRLGWARVVLLHLLLQQGVHLTLLRWPSPVTLSSTRQILQQQRVVGVKLLRIPLRSGLIGHGPLLHSPRCAAVREVWRREGGQAWGRAAEKFEAWQSRKGDHVERRWTPHLLRQSWAWMRRWFRETRDQGRHPNCQTTLRRTE
jgi:hypothetical protein